MTASALIRGVLDLLAPHRCATCDEPLPPGPAGFCDGCALLLDPAADRDGGRAAFVYGGPMAEAIRRYKYGGRAELAAPLGRLLADAAGPLAGAVDAVIPVPLHPRRLRARGFDQVALLARPVARAVGAPVRLDVLARTRDTPPQAGLEAERRLDNVRGAFSSRACPSRVLLIDDVRTTGATLTECADALRSAGASVIRTLVLARAEP